MDLESGRKVVHKTHGVGTICGIEEKNYGAGPEDFYLLKLDSTGVMIRFPAAVKSAVVRSLASTEEIDKIFSILKSPSRSYSMVWNRRKKELNEKIKSGSLFEIAEVLRDLTGMKGGKDLSFGEKEMLEKAKERLVYEISTAKAVGYDQVEQQLDKILYKH